MCWRTPLVPRFQLPPVAHPGSIDRGAPILPEWESPLPFSSGDFGRDSSRRRFLAQCGGGFGAVACAGMLASEGFAGGELPKPHFTAKAKQVIYLFMHGGPSHVDLFDPKPELIKYAGQPLPESFGEVKTRRKVAANPLLGPVKPFRPRGEAGIGDQRLPAAHRRVGRRAVRPPQLSRRQREPSAVGVSDEHRQHPHGAAEPGELGGVWVGE